MSWAPSSPVDNETSTPSVRPSPVFWGVVAATVLGVVFCVTGSVGDRPATFLFVTAGWVLSLIGHEFGHAFVAWRNGDQSVAARGYLDLDPRRYTDPWLSIGIPVVLVALGGIGLPGGAVWINRSALRSRAAMSAVSLAGPTMTLVAAVVCIVPVTTGVVDSGSTLAAALSFLGFIQVTALVLNLLPIPGLDGFGAIEPHLPPPILDAVAPLRRYGMLILFVGLWWIEPINRGFWRLVLSVVDLAGLDPDLVFTGYDLFRFWVPS